MFANTVPFCCNLASILANTFTVTKAQVIYTLCLPLAVLLGFFLADPVQLGSMAVVVLVIAIIAFPLFMKWYHPLLILSCNAYFVLRFLPGAPALWVVITALSLFVVLLNRCVDSKRRLMVGGGIPWALLFLGLVVFATAFLTGGAGLRALGSSTYGGKKYIYIAAGIASYFVLASQQIPLSRAKLYGALFFLSGTTALLSVAVVASGDHLWQLNYIVPHDEYNAAGDTFNVGIARVAALVSVSSAICLFLLSRYGVKGILDVSKPWRFPLLLASLGLGLFGGFRSFFGFIVLVFAIAFFLEGLHRTRYLLHLLLAGTLCFSGLLVFSTKLPLVIQRSVSFLPVSIDPAAKQEAQGSWEWRVDMWKQVLPDVPRYFFKGKGYSLNPGELAMSRENAFRGFGASSDPLALSGDYHNGPLSVLIPFGIWGAIALTWFVCAALRLLYLNFVYGDPALKSLNCILLSCFIARVIFFLFLAGGFEADLAYFTALAGLGLSLNGPVRARQERPELEAVPEFST
jgi:hypothetical protein